MCLILVSLTGQLPFSDEQLAVLLELNQDGAGFMYAFEGQLYLVKSRHPDVPWIRAQFARVPGPRLTVLHLRQATSGPLDEENVQPISVWHDPGYQLALAHNGTLPKYTGDERRSDSSLFASRTVRPWREKRGLAWARPQALAELASHLPAVNRVVLLDSQGTWAILSEAEGFWYADTWMSNPNVRSILC